MKRPVPAYKYLWPISWGSKILLVGVLAASFAIGPASGAVLLGLLFLIAYCTGALDQVMRQSRELDERRRLDDT